LAYTRTGLLEVDQMNGPDAIDTSMSTSMSIFVSLYLCICNPLCVCV